MRIGVDIGGTKMLLLTQGQDVRDLQPQTTAAVVMVGTGIGAAIYVNGQVLRGANGWAGELESIPINGDTLDRIRLFAESPED